MDTDRGVGVLSGRALAAWLLGTSLVRVIVRLLFTKQAPGLEEFHENYGEDGLLAVTEEERQTMTRYSGCIACGRCDVGESERMAESEGQYPGLMQLVLASTRSMPDYDAAAKGFSYIPEEVLRAKVRLCPARIPFAELAAFVQAKAPKRPPGLPAIEAATERQAEVKNAV